MARRRSMMTQRLQKMKDISPEERDLLVRIGRTIDGAINNRGPTNPSNTGQVKIGRANSNIPPPDNITQERSIQSVKIAWDAVDSPILAYYQLIFLRIDDGISYTKTAYEPRLTFNGRSGGYRVFISSIARNGTSSVQKEFATTLLDNVMLLEGAKNTPDVTGTSVSETIYVPKGYTVFAWAAFTLNDHAFESDNLTPKIVLKRSTIPNDISTAATVQEITAFPQSETLTSLNVGLGLNSGPISRPINIGAPADTGNNETSQTIMFTPLTLDDKDTGKDHTFYLSIEDRTTNDVKGLSIVLWVATGGRGFDLNVGFGAHAVSLRHANDVLQVLPPKAALGTEWGNPAFTLAYWFKWTSLVSGRTYIPIQTTQSTGGAKNSLNVSLSTFTLGSPQVSLFIGMKQGALGDGNDGNGGTNIYRDFTASSNLQGVLLPTGANAWVHHVITYEAGPPNRVRVYVNGVLSVSNDAGDSVAAFIQNQIGPPSMNPKPDGTIAGGTNPTAAPGSSLQESNLNLWETAIWKSLLTQVEITELYNNGNGVQRLLSSNIGSYSSAGNLSIYWKYGQDKSNVDLTIGSTTITDNLSTIWSGTSQTSIPWFVVDDYPGKT